MKGNFIALLLLLLALLWAQPVWAQPGHAQKGKLLGTISSVNKDKQVVTIRNNDTNKRHTYFINERTQLLSNGERLTLDDLQAGQSVKLDFTRTDLGRELNIIRIPDPGQRAALLPVEAETDYFVSGTVTGVRPEKRTVTIHGPLLTQRITLHLPESIQLLRDGKPFKLTKLKKGEVVEFLYRESLQGFIIVSGEVTGG